MFLFRLIRLCFLVKSHRLKEQFSAGMRCFYGESNPRCPTGAVVVLGGVCLWILLTASVHTQPFLKEEPCSCSPGRLTFEYIQKWTHLCTFCFTTLSTISNLYLQRNVIAVTGADIHSSRHMNSGILVTQSEVQPLHWWLDKNRKVMGHITKKQKLSMCQNWLCVCDWLDCALAFV